MPSDLSLRIVSQADLGAAHFLLTMRPESAATRLPAWEPGQFAMITLGPASGTNDPLLRRPFSIFNQPGVPEGSVQILYKVLGRGTALLSRARAGDAIRCLMPLGNGFALAQRADARLLLVAGGIGSASLHPLAIADRQRGGQPLLLYGCRTASELAGVRPTRDAGVEVLVSTDDGSSGQKGYVSDLLDAFLRREASGPGGLAGWTICACGPTPMMKATAAVAAYHGVTCHVSLESPMACGFGVCVGCVVGTRAADDQPLRYRRICVDGPVFDAAEVCW
jgi:dihydroorotate dehydrogenase electron transfer subunit